MLPAGRKPRVAVIGAGVAGLTIAVMLTENRFGPEVTMIAEDFSPNITSDAAGGMMRLGDRKASSTDPRTDRWLAETYQHFAQLFASSLAARLNLSLVTSYTIFDGHREDPYMKDLVFGFHHASAEEKKALNIPEDKNVWSYSTFCMSCTPYLAWQMEQFIAKGGTVLKQKVNGLQDVEGTYDIVVNCSGLGSRELVNDQEMYPIRGQVVALKAPWVKQLIAAEVEGRFTYIIPRSDEVIIGGTTQVGNWSTEIDPSDREDIIARCSKFVPGLAQAEIVNEWVGLRPGRKRVRLEAEVISSKTTVVHNYGHAGKGLAFSVGCAKDTLSLIEASLTEKGF